MRAFVDESAATDIADIVDRPDELSRFCRASSLDVLDLGECFDGALGIPFHEVGFPEEPVSILQDPPALARLRDCLEVLDRAIQPRFAMSENAAKDFRPSFVDPSEAREVVSVVSKARSRSVIASE